MKGAVGQYAPVIASQSSQGVFPVGWVDPALHGQVLHRTGGLYVPEQAPDIAAAGHGQAGDGMPLPLEGPSKGGNGGKVRPRQVDVGLQADGLPLRPGIQRTIFRQGDQILRGPDVDLTGLSGQSSRSRQGKQQHRHYKEAQALIAFLSHLLAPPRSDRFPPPAYRRRRRG